MKLDMSNVTSLDDAALVADVMGGNRDAFGKLVARYQSSVCSLAYSACGNLSQSEDLAQETFITAWRKLASLEEPAKFKSWLYGIARNLVHNSSRRETRNPLAASEALDETLAVGESTASPTEHAISKEEQAILWRSLEQIPSIYREPLILFYREHESIGQVAAILGMSEGAARQRLSRGRKLLHERVLAFVEGALEQTAPGPAFTLGVLTALPAMTLSAKAAMFGAAAKGGTVAKGAGLLGAFGAFLMPLFMLFGMVVDYRQWKKAGLPGGALKPMKRYYSTIAFSVFFVVVVTCLLMDRGAAIVGKSPGLFVASLVGLFLGYFLIIGFFARRFFRLQRATREEYKTLDQNVGSVWEYRSPAKLLGLPLLHIRWGRRSYVPSWKPVQGWIAITDGCAIGGLFAYGGLAVAPLSVGACAVGLVSYGAMAVGVLSWGGFSFGAWAFGAFTCGWEAFSGGCAFAWHLAWGYQYAIAHDYALGAGTVHALQANTPFVQQLVQSSWGRDLAIALSGWFYWLMWVWAIPMMISMGAGWISVARPRKASAASTH
ncbi:MAG TPA: sigma-70 family RNA polymerase sigma factor [Verrucomicrobiae bacterium]|nr:sigma-70 family RNA polymerase sigma factor [Verrucomicrobiae bacterium]